MASRWSPGSAVRRDDQFTAAPGFIGPHDSDHLGGPEASWHGPSRRTVVAASLAAIAGALGAFALLFADAPGGPEASPAGQGLAAEPPGSPGLPDAGHGAGSLLNSTAPAPAPAPTPSPFLPVPGEAPGRGV